MFYCVYGLMSEIKNYYYYYYYYSVFCQKVAKVEHTICDCN